MTIDRTAKAALVDALRHIAEVRAGLSDRSLPPEAVKRVQDYIDIAIVALDAKDRRIAEIEAACQSARSGAAEAVAAHDAQVARIAELEAGGTVKDALIRELDADLLSVRNICAVQLARAVNLERNFNEAVRRVSEVETKLSIATELNVNDRKRIAELETGLREALAMYSEVVHGNAGRTRWSAYNRLRDLLPSEGK